jgi:hypothetical protein
MLKVIPYYSCSRKILGDLAGRAEAELAQSASKVKSCYSCSSNSGRPCRLIDE